MFLYDRVTERVFPTATLAQQSVKVKKTFGPYGFRSVYLSLSTPMWPNVLPILAEDHCLKFIRRSLLHCWEHMAVSVHRQHDR